LKIWEDSHNLVLEIYNILKVFPKNEEYGLTSQIKRAVISIPTNIVEGHSKNSNKDFLRFLYISRGSLEEVKYLLFLSKELSFIQNDKYKEIEKKLSKLSYMLNKFIKYIQSTINNHNNHKNPNNHNNHKNPNNQNNHKNPNNFNNE